MAAERVYIGIDPTAGKRDLSYAVLDGDLTILAQADSSFEGIVEALKAYGTALCAIDAPSGPSLGLMEEPSYRERLGLRPNASRYASYRVSEYELRRRNIGLYRTPRNPDEAPAWMKMGWKLYETLGEMGYLRYPQAGPLQMFEVHPHACYTALLDRRPYSKNSFEGRLQRQLVLYEEGVNLEDPMGMFEEWTRHRVLSSQLPLDDLHQHDWLDALVAAYTAYLLGEEPVRTSSLGDPAEGMIIVPSGRLRDRYR